MQDKERVIEKMQISLIDIENNINTFELERADHGKEIFWKCADEAFPLEIMTDDEIKNTEILRKPENLAESDEIIKQKFYLLDS